MNYKLSAAQLIDLADTNNRGLTALAETMGQLLEIPAWQLRDYACGATPHPPYVGESPVWRGALGTGSAGVANHAANASDRVINH